MHRDQGLLLVHFFQLRSLPRQCLMQTSGWGCWGHQRPAAGAIDMFASSLVCTACRPCSFKYPKYRLPLDFIFLQWMATWMDDSVIAGTTTFGITSRLKNRTPCCSQTALSSTYFYSMWCHGQELIESSQWKLALYACTLSYMYDLDKCLSAT